MENHQNNFSKKGVITSMCPVVTTVTTVKFQFDCWLSLVKLNESEAKVILTLQYWISFIESKCSNRLKPTTLLMIVSSCASQLLPMDQKWFDIIKLASLSALPCIAWGVKALNLLQTGF